MSIIGSQISEGCTPGFTGGTSKTFTQTGLKVNGGVQVADASVASVTTRPTGTFRSTPESVDSKTGKWSRSYRDITSTRPKVLADLTQEFPSMRVKANLHPEMTTAEILALRIQTAQMILDPDYDAFWNTGALG